MSLSLVKEMVGTTKIETPLLKVTMPVCFVHGLIVEGCGECGGVNRGDLWPAHGG